MLGVCNVYSGSAMASVQSVVADGAAFVVVAAASFGVRYSFVSSTRDTPCARFTICACQ